MAEPQKGEEAHVYPRFLEATALVAGQLGLEVVLGVAIGRLGGQFVEALPLYGIARALAFLVIARIGLKKTGRAWTEVFPLARVRPILLVPSIVAVSGLAVLVGIVGRVMEDVAPMPAELKRLIERELSRGGIAGYVFNGVVVTAIVEECLTRGLILRGFVANYGTRKAIVFSALLFALLHLNPWQFFVTFSAGLLFGWWAVVTGSLILPILGHGLLNLAALSPWPSDDQLSQTAIWSGPVALSAVVLGCALFRRLTRESFPAGGPGPLSRESASR